MEIDRSLIGRSTPEMIFEVEKGRIRRFADTFDDRNPVYWDEEVAKKSRYGGIVAPSVFPAALIAEAGFPLKLDFRRILHGEEEIIYHRKIRAGDRLHCQVKVADVYERTGQKGTIKFIVFELEARDEAGSPVVTCRTTAIHR
jgi:acyl dehydratase